MIESLHQLPWEIQITLASGYLGYVLGYAGIRDRHNKTDMVMTILIFGLIGYTAYLVVISLGFTALSGIARNIAGGVAALVASSAAGALWHYGLRKKMLKGLRENDILRDDGAPNVWRSILELDEAEPTQMFVKLKTGETLCCDELHRFAEQPYGPCLWGADQSIALYVTRIIEDGETIEKEADIFHPTLGSLLTIVQASEISGITLRLRPR